MGNQQSFNTINYSVYGSDNHLGSSVVPSNTAHLDADVVVPTGLNPLIAKIKHDDLSKFHEFLYSLSTEDQHDGIFGNLFSDQAGSISGTIACSASSFSQIEKAINESISVAIKGLRVIDDRFKEARQWIENTQEILHKLRHAKRNVYSISSKENVIDLHDGEDKIARAMRNLEFDFRKLDPEKSPVPKIEIVEIDVVLCVRLYRSVFGLRQIMSAARQEASCDVQGSFPSVLNYVALPKNSVVEKLRDNFDDDYALVGQDHVAIVGDNFGVSINGDDRGDAVYMPYLLQSTVNTVKTNEGQLSDIHYGAVRLRDELQDLDPSMLIVPKLTRLYMSSRKQSHHFTIHEDAIFEPRMNTMKSITGTSHPNGRLDGIFAKPIEIEIKKSASESSKYYLISTYGLGWSLRDEIKAMSDREHSDNKVSIWMRGRVGIIGRILSGGTSPGAEVSCGLLYEKGGKSVLASFDVISRQTITDKTTLNLFEFCIELDEMDPNGAAKLGHARDFSVVVWTTTENHGYKSVDVDVTFTGIDVYQLSGLPSLISDGKIYKNMSLYEFFCALKNPDKSVGTPFHVQEVWNDYISQYSKYMTEFVFHLMHMEHYPIIYANYLRILKNKGCKLNGEREFKSYIDVRDFFKLAYENMDKWLLVKRNNPIDLLIPDNINFKQSLCFQLVSTLFVVIQGSHYWNKIYPPSALVVKQLEQIASNLK